MKSLREYTGKYEWLLQFLFLIVLFILFTYEKHNDVFDMARIAFFSLYAGVALFIGYYINPKYLYRQKYKQYVIWILVCLVFLYFMEELVLEKIFYTGKRATHISNFFFTLLGILPMVFIMVSFKFNLDFIHKQGEMEQLRAAADDSELRYLKSQVNPHFLFNNLNNLYAYAIEQSPKTPEIILELSAVLRYMLYDCKEDSVLLTKEIAHLQHFTALNQLQIEDRGEVNFMISAIPENYVIAPLILLMFIENAFKHSTGSMSDDILVDIAIDVNREGQLHFYCENSYRGTSNNDSLDKGIGLENVQKRLKMLYPNSHDLQIETTDTSYKVNLSMQLEKLEDK
ncbi:MAG: histidine kinase [Flavobacteriaceae bacterium]|nr:histidine kinase [Flavobacteriaceae bacterium]